METSRAGAMPGCYAAFLMGVMFNAALSVCLAQWRAGEPRPSQPITVRVLIDGASETLPVLVPAKPPSAGEAPRSTPRAHPRGGVVFDSRSPAS
jgi:hypothetical protein